MTSFFACILFKIRNVLYTSQLSRNSACPSCALNTMVSIFNSWSIAAFTVSWLISSQQSNRTHFR